MLTSIFTIKIVSRINGINFLLVIPGRLYPVKILYVYVAYQGIKKAIVQILPAWMQFRDLILCVWKYRNTLSQMKNERSCREKFKLRLLGLQLGKIASEIHFLKLYKSKELSRAQFCCCSCMWKYLDLDWQCFPIVPSKSNHLDIKFWKKIKEYKCRRKKKNLTCYFFP